MLAQVKQPVPTSVSQGSALPEHCAPCTKIAASSAICRACILSVRLLQTISNTAEGLRPNPGLLPLIGMHEAHGKID